MLEWLNKNPLLVLAFFVVVVFVLMFIFVRVKKKKPKTEESKKAADVDTSSGEEKPAEEIKVRAKKAKIRPQIEQLYKKQVVKEDVVQEEDSEEIDGKQAQFVKTTSKVSKFIGFEEVAKKEEDLLQSMQTEEGFSQEDCELCEPKLKHFDHTRRLSKMIQEDSFDDMLDAHISQHYLNIDENRHLRISDDFSEKLFERAMKTLSNSDVKVLVDEENSEDKPFEKMRGDKEYMKRWLADRKRENMANFIASTDSGNENELDEETIQKLKNDIDLSPKNIIVVDSIVNRKGKRKK